MLTKLNKEITVKENAHYTAQLHPYHGRVYAEILCKHTSFQMGGFWSTIADKSFGNPFSGLKDKNFEDAHKWIDEQFRMIEKHCTAIINTPKRIYDYEIMEKLK